jgi:hypothetical protein
MATTGPGDGRRAQRRLEAVMSIEDRIPEMNDKELANLRDNAMRLAQSGAPKQQAEAARLIPIIEAASEERRTANAAALVEKKKTRQQDLATARTKKAAARKRAADEAEAGKTA